ncbi:phospholipase D-like domain-containing protein [Flavobacterium sp. N2038]|uniref:phospholipase D-like domain-containing protein n=1 Tax=Flavobacterium sp. N2038 TaxID=2986829 RepID=UPI0022246F63|nr:phospholipase D-like domain-containing protein [Flavobacterium sp. N2038]
MQNAIAFSNNDVITIAWSLGEKPTGCLGFAIYRIDDKGIETALPNKAVFENFPSSDDKSSKLFPIQKFYWKDVYARLVAEKTKNRIFQYKIVPMKGSPGHLIPMENYAPMLTNKVEISANAGNNMYAYFNRGIISTQRVSNYLNGNLNVDSLRALAADYKGNHELRDSLSGDMVEALIGFLDRTKEGGEIFAGLYELGDPELIEKLCSLGNKLNIVLSNSAKQENDEEKGKYINKEGKEVFHKKTVDDNDHARESLKNSGAVSHARIMPSGHIGHNKFLVYVNAQGVPKAVLFGSTNWTPTGLCTQTNNTMVIEDEALAKRYLAYWNEMKTDTINANGQSKKLQSTDFRTQNAAGKTLQIGDISLQSWFSPNTPAARGKRSPDEPTPVDMKEVIKCIDNAKEAILFLAFYPGAPSLANWTAKAVKNKKDLFVRGMVTNDSASENFYYDLIDEVPPKREKNVPIKEDFRVGSADAFNGTNMPEGWKKEILSAGFAIIHDKIMVIDPFSENCVVVTGSHNLGYKASYDNDENLAIIKGNKKLALAYATHVLDIYDHFNFRIYYKKKGLTNAFLETDSDVFLAKYFDKKGKIKNSQLKFWMDGASKIL